MSVYAYIGNWRSPRLSEPVGIAAASYEPETGAIQVFAHYAEMLNAGAVCLDAARDILYYVNERTEVPGETLGGQVYAFQINRTSGTLEEIGRTPSFGTLPSYCAVDATHSFLLVSHHAGSNAITKTVQDSTGYHLSQEYDEAALVLFPLDTNGMPLPPCDLVPHTGRGALPNQKSAHLHSVIKAPKGNLFAVCDKGTDTFYLYTVDVQKKKLVLTDKFTAAPGSSPRYTAFHPTEPFLYFNNESKTVLDAMRYDESGKLSHICSVSCMAGGSLTEKGMQSELLMHPAGLYLYDVVRDNSTIVVYAINQETGIPALRQVFQCACSRGGRGLAVSPDGQYLFFATSPDKELYRYTISEDGRLTNETVAAVDEAPGNIMFYTP